MSIRFRLLLAVLLLLPTPAAAHGPTPHKAEERVIIAVPPAVVWGMVSDLAGIAAWHPLVVACAAKTGSSGGLERTLTLSGGQLTESLDELDTAARTVSYRLLKPDLDAFPVSFYSASIAVSEAPGNASAVVWSARFYRGDTGNYPPETLDDAAARAAITSFLRAGLDGLKGKAERR